VLPPDLSAADDRGTLANRRIDAMPCFQAQSPNMALKGDPMPSTDTSPALGAVAPDFSLPGVDGRTWRYAAQCTPEFYGLDRDRVLRYHGRLDASGRQAAAPGAKRELFDAMQQVVDEGHGPEVQHASIGCSIKWLRD
jgi:hypothetical protein